MARRHRSGWARRAATRLQQLEAGAERQAELLEVLVGELRQDRGVDLVVAEHRLVALQAEAPEPSRDVHLAFPAQAFQHRFSAGIYHKP